MSHNTFAHAVSIDDVLRLMFDVVQDFLADSIADLGQIKRKTSISCELSLFCISNDLSDSSLLDLREHSDVLLNELRICSAKSS